MHFNDSLENWCISPNFFKLFKHLINIYNAMKWIFV